jgi:F5/8 type C domain
MSGEASTGFPARRTPATLAACALLLLATLVAATWSRAQSDGSAPPTALDRFDDLAPWHVVVSDGVKASILPADGISGHAMRLSFDLAGTAGYALAHRPLALDLPENYELSFYVRADAPVNNLQVKLVDATGDNVWWFNRPNFDIGTAWRHVRIKKRQIEFAWGPTKDRRLTHSASIELVVAAGRDGGAGRLYFSDLTIHALPRDPLVWLAPAVRASSQLPGAGAELAFDGHVNSAWKSDPATGSEQWLTMDFGRTREIGGLMIRWVEGLSASRYDVELSDDAAQWRTARTLTDARGDINAAYLPDTETRYVRLALHKGEARAAGYAISEVEVEDVAFGSSPNAFVAAIAREFPRGYFPRGFNGEQTYWTLVGGDRPGETGLISEDGALEVGKGSFSIEPFVVTDGKVATWADVATSQDLADGYLPMPGVTWQTPQWTLHVTAFGSHAAMRTTIVARYELTNRTDHVMHSELVLAVRPFQVNPPSQTLNTLGGVSPIHDIAWNGTSLGVDAVRNVFPLRRPDRIGVFGLDAGPLARLLGSRTWSTRSIASRGHDDQGYASAAMAYQLALPAHGRTVVDVVVPMRGADVPVTLASRDAASWSERQQRAVAQDWRARLNRVALTVPPSAQALADTLRTALAHILMTRDGAMLRPGTRSYARSWIRDGAMMSEALLRLGHADVAADYLRWYAPHQFDNGKIPCCVDTRGADPVPENDSEGEFILLAAEIFRYTHDRTLAEQMWPRVAKAIDYMESLRASERTDAVLNSEQAAIHGLLPASISHEGYSEKPMHSYWDDFWAMKGYESAVELAIALGHDADAAHIAQQRDEFRQDLAASIRASTAAHAIAYLPGAVELGDFDPTSSSIAFAPGAEVRDLPPDMVGATFEKYWREFVARRDGSKQWEDYTPYELRTVGTFVRMGWRDRAQQLLQFFLADRRPQAWNQWAEVVGRNPRQARFIGDMPHGWIASDFIRSVLDLFAYERYGDHALVVAAGIPMAWIEQHAVGIDSLRTPYGNLSYSLRSDGGFVTLDLRGGMQVPPGGFVFKWPAETPPPARVNGRQATWEAGELRILELPARVVMDARATASAATNRAH